MKNDDWTGFVKAWCKANELVYKVAIVRLHTTDAHHEARRQYRSEQRASDRVLNNILRKAAIECGLLN